jgi:hypothetical protein
MVQDVLKITGTNAKVAARLCNFSTGESFLLSTHLEFLDNEVRNTLRNIQWPWVDLYGYASRAGDARFNLDLSSRRIDVVKGRVAQYTDRVNFVIHKALGETQSGPNERNDDGYYRAVEVYIFGNKPPAPTPKANVRRVLSRSFRKFESKQDLGGYSQPDPQKDALNDLLKFGIAAAQGKFSAEAFLGTEEGRDVGDRPSGHRVIKMTSDQRVFYHVSVGGYTVTTTTTLTYEWGPPFSSVNVETRYQFTWDDETNPAIIEKTSIPRHQAEATLLIVPPDA